MRHFKAWCVKVDVSPMPFCHRADAASVGLNRQLCSNPVRGLSQCDESNHGRTNKPFSVAPNGAFLFHLVRALGRKPPQALFGRHDVA